MIYMIYKGIKLFQKNIKREISIFLVHTFTKIFVTEIIVFLIYITIIFAIASPLLVNAATSFTFEFSTAWKWKHKTNISMKYWCISCNNHQKFYIVYENFTGARICVTIFQFSWFSGTRPSKFLWFRYSSCSVSSSSTARLRTWAIVPWCPLTIN